MTAPATRQTGRAGLDSAAAPMITINNDSKNSNNNDGDTGIYRDSATRRRGADTRNPTRAVTRGGGGKGGVIKGGGGGAASMSAANAAAMRRVAEMKAKKDEDVEELYLAGERLEETPTVIEK